MKHSLKLLILTLIVMTASIASAQVRGNGNVTRETRSLSPFNSIEVDGVVNLILIQGDREYAEVEADKNLQPYISLKVSGDKLNISTNEDIDIEKTTKMNVYVTFKDIKSLDLNGVGNARSEGRLDLTSLNIENSGVGNIDIEMNGSTLKAQNNSVGNMIFSGNVNNVDIEHNGVGNIKAFDLTAGILKIESNAVGNAEVKSNDEIYITLNGIGNVSYKGNAVVKQMNVNGMGKVSKE